MCIRDRVGDEHQNKPDVAGAKAREWFDTQGVDMLVGGTNSGTALAMAKVAQEKKKLYISVGAATSALTNEQCSPYTCLLYTSDAADERSSVDLGGRRIIK